MDNFSTVYLTFDISLRRNACDRFAEDIIMLKQHDLWSDNIKHTKHKILFLARWNRPHMTVERVTVMWLSELKQSGEPQMSCVQHTAHALQVDARLMTKSVAKKERKKGHCCATEVCMRMREELSLPGRHNVVDVNSRSNLVRLYAGNVSETKRAPASRPGHLRGARGPLRDAGYHVIYYITKNDYCCLHQHLTL